MIAIPLYDLPGAVLAAVGAIGLAWIFVRGLFNVVRWFIR